MADGATVGIWGSIGAAGVALLWVLVRRARRARRLMPRGRLRAAFQFSLRTPETDPPKEAPRRFRRDMLSLPEPGMSDPPIELEGLDALEPDVEREPFSDRPTDRPTPDSKRRRPHR